MALIQETLREIVRFSKEDEEEFVRVVKAEAENQQSSEIKGQKTRLAACKKRLDELETLMHKNLVDKFVQHHGVQFFKILIFLDQCDEFIGGFLAAFVFVYCFLQGSSFRFKAFLLLGVLGIQNLIPLVREFSEGVVLIDFA